MKGFFLKYKTFWLIPLIVFIAIVVVVLFMTPITEKPFDYTIH